MSSPFPTDLLASEFLRAAGIDHGNLVGVQTFLQGLDLFQPLCLKLRLEAHTLNFGCRGICGPLPLEPPFPAAVEDGHRREAEILERPPDASGIGQVAAVDDDLRIALDPELPHFFAPGVGVVEAAFL